MQGRDTLAVNVFSLVGSLIILVLLEPFYRPFTQSEKRTSIKYIKIKERIHEKN